VKGDQGDPGTFAGHFASPNGKFSLDVTDNGIVMKGPGDSVTIDGNGLTIKSDGNFYPVTYYGEQYYGYPSEFDGYETHYGTEEHHGYELHYDTEEYRGLEYHYAREFHYGLEDHYGHTVFENNCSDDPAQFYKVNVGLNAGGTPFFSPAVAACK
jgi:hypothetical protein